jgi:hypothetical protein
LSLPTRTTSERTPGAVLATLASLVGGRRLSHMVTRIPDRRWLEVASGTRREVHASFVFRAVEPRFDAARPLHAGEVRPARRNPRAGFLPADGRNFNREMKSAWKLRPGSRLRVGGPGQGLRGEGMVGGPVLGRWALRRAFRWSPLRLVRLRFERECVDVVCPLLLLGLSDERRSKVRAIGWNVRPEPRLS